jgi:NTP pyrophosphatase (non-canonical NTP hydrolase)
MVGISEKDNIYFKAIEKWGEQAQIGMAIEECSELITCLVKLGRNKNSSTKEQVIDEIADVMIMMEQLQHVFGFSKVADRKDFKLTRLKQRVDEWEP